MSPPVDLGIGQNAVMCYFPDLPYYLSYQIGFDTVINPLQEQVDPTVAGQPMRLIYVPLYAPGGFTGNAATMGGMPHRATMGGMPHLHSFRSDVPQFFHRRPAFYPSPFSDFSHVTPQFDHHDPMIFGGPVILEEVHHHSRTRTFEYIGNGRPVQIMEVNDTLYDIPPCELHREPDRAHNEPPQRSPKPVPSQKPKKQPQHSHHQPSTSGIRGQMDTSCASPSKASGGVATVDSETDKSHASPRKASGGVATVVSQTDKSRASSRKASGGVATVGSQTDKSRASPRKAGERVATEHKDRLQKKVETNFTQQMPEEHQKGSPDDAQVIQCTNGTLPEPAAVPVNITILPPGLDGQNSDDNQAQDNEKPNRDPKVDDN